MIVHAGDVGDPIVLEQLRALAPVFAVRGNVDSGRWAAQLPATRIVSAGDLRFFVLHQLSDLEVDPKAEGFAAVISGHSHRFGAETKDGVLYLNPGAAGPRRFTLPLTVARLQVVGKHLSHEIIELRLRT